MDDLDVLIVHAVGELTWSDVDDNWSFSQQLIEIVRHTRAPWLGINRKLNSTASALLGMTTTPASSSVLHW